MRLKATFTFPRGTEPVEMLRIASDVATAVRAVTRAAKDSGRLPARANLKLVFDGSEEELAVIGLTMPGAPQ